VLCLNWRDTRHPEGGGEDGRDQDQLLQDVARDHGRQYGDQRVGGDRTRHAAAQAEAVRQQALSRDEAHVVPENEAAGDHGREDRNGE
jgi:hypothetical protein